MTDFETLPADWLSVDEAIQRVLAHVPPLDVEEVSLQEALGRALAEDLVATATLPPWDNSAMDGYAVRQGDLREASSADPVSLKVVGQVMAGARQERVLAAGEAVRIMTGGPLPPGADAIVRVEDTDAEETPGTVRVFSAPPPGKDVRPGGQDMASGDTLLPAGTAVGAGQTGVLAATGASRVRVRERPRVAILSNGDEIAPVGDFHRVLAGEAIPETNGPTLEAAVRGAGAVPLPLGIAPDDGKAILEKVKEARVLGAQLLITSGGASMGEHDLLKRTLNEAGFQLGFWRVKMRPGTPFSFGHLPSGGNGAALPVFGLPGNPASSFVTFQIFCRPYLLKMAGHSRIHRPVIRARAGEDFRSPARLTHFFRVRLETKDGSPVATPTGPQTSGLVLGQGLAQGLAVVGEGRKAVLEGESLPVILLDDFGMGGSDPGYLPA